MRANSSLSLFLFWAIAVFTLTIPAALFAGSAEIDSICCALTPGGLVSIEGYNFDQTATVRVGGLNAPVLHFQWFYCQMPGCQAGLQVQLPVELAPGPTTLEIISGGVNSRPMPITLEAYGPDFLRPIITGEVYIEKALPNGGFAPTSCSAGQTLMDGELVRTYVTGLGPTAPVIPTGVYAPTAPLANTVLKPAIFLGGQAAEVFESVLAPGQIGTYRVTFKVPPKDDMRTITIGIGGKSTMAYPFVGIASGSLAYKAAAESIQTASACGNLVGNAGKLTGDPTAPQTTLDGISVLVRDSDGVERPAPVLAADSNLVDYIVPAGTVNGFAKVTITSVDGALSTGTLDIQSVAPGTLSASSPPVVVVRVRDGIQSVEPAVGANALGEYEPVPIDLGPETDQVYLIVFGTGWRFRAGQPNATGSAVIFDTESGANTVTVTADYAGPQGEFAGVDQMNVRLPRSLAGRGDVYGYLRVDGQRTGFFARLSFK